MKRPSLRRPRLATGALIAAGLAVLIVTSGASSSKKEDPYPFYDVRKQAPELIQLYRTLKLTPEQEAIKKEALTPLPAPCCSDNTAYTCCCPCNMAQTIWGLSALLIVEHGYGAQEVREKVEDWIAFIHPGGFSGDVCYTGGCGRPFAKNGCGGMNPQRVIFDG